MQTKTNNLKSRSYLFSINLIKFIGIIKITIINKIIINQLIRSGTSIGANIMEAQGSVSKKEFIKYLSIALKSSHETKYWLYLLKEIEQDKKEKIQEFINENEEIHKMTSSAIITLKGKK